MELKLNQLLSEGKFLSLDVQKPFQDLLIVVKNRVGSEPGENQTLDVFCKEFLQKCRATIQFIDASGTVTRLFNEVELLQILDYATLADGHAFVQNYDTFDKVAEFQFKIPIGVGGAVNMSDNELVRVILEMDNTATLATLVMYDVSLYGLESPTRTFICTQFDKLSVPQGQTVKVFPLNARRMLVFPSIELAPAYKNTQVRYSNGQTVNLSKKELRAVCCTNELMIGGDTEISGSKYSHVLACHEAVEVTIDVVDATYYGFYAVSDVVVSKPSESQKVNNGLYDTHEQVLALQAAQKEQA